MSVAAEKKGFFPSISRFITEKWKIILVGLVSVVILFGIALQGLLLSQNLKEVDELQKGKVKLASELSYWQQVVKEYEGYRDAYFRIASLQFSLGKVDEAKESLEKVLSLDPNFREATVLGERIEAR